ncbi:phosphopantetheine-binding protein [Cohnella mopanensis]|uniref:phosphopantetheine-binding protein n=1 Tax=Cohnella mopanensis TaxID=2911966 RepID=UPI001EF896B6|nr:phosphopantetheine-binding protein [Cohnella mopanensis]
MSMDDRLKEILIRSTRKTISAEEIVSDTDLVNELALDSILIVNLFADLEEEFNITILVHEINKPILSEYRLLREYVQERMVLQESQ